MTAQDDLEGCTAALQWLAFVPAVLGGVPPCLPTSDPLDRPIGYMPGPGGLPVTPRTAPYLQKALEDRGTTASLSSPNHIHVRRYTFRFWG